MITRQVSRHFTPSKTTLKPLKSFHTSNIVPNISLAIFVNLILIIPQVSSRAKSDLASTHLFVTRVGPCDDRPSVVVTVPEMVLYQHKNYQISISGVVNVSQDIPNGWNIRRKTEPLGKILSSSITEQLQWNYWEYTDDLWLQGTMQKCHDIRNMDTCDLLKDQEIVNGGCVEKSSQESLYNKFFQYVKPRIGCPIKAGSYRISNYPFYAENSDLAPAQSKISTSVFGYTYRLEMMDDDDIRLLCIEASLQLQYVRNHDWMGDHTSSTTAASTLPTLVGKVDHNHQEEREDDETAGQMDE